MDMPLKRTIQAAKRHGVFVADSIAEYMSLSNGLLSIWLRVATNSPPCPFERLFSQMTGFLVGSGGVAETRHPFLLKMRFKSETGL